MLLLLTSLVLLISASYAWFALSKAPEVTGVETTVGANGALEIALLTGETYANPNRITNGVGTSKSVTDVTASNLTWGNQVDLSDASYGLSSLILRPSALNLTESSTVGTTILKTAEYGFDGRISALNANTMEALYSPEHFAFDSAGKGVRALGVSTGMTARQINYRDEFSAAGSYASSAYQTMTAAVEADGRNISQIMISYMSVLDGESVDDIVITGEQIASISSVYSLLHNQEDAGVYDDIKKAIISYARVYALSGAGPSDDDAALAKASSIVSLGDIYTDDDMPDSLKDTALEVEQAISTSVSNVALLPSALIDDEGESYYEDSTYGVLGGSVSTLVDMSVVQIRCSNGEFQAISDIDGEDVFGVDIDLTDGASDEVIAAVYALFIEKGLEYAIPYNAGLLGKTADLCGAASSSYMLDLRETIDKYANYSEDTYDALAENVKATTYMMPQNSGRLSEIREQVNGMMPDGTSMSTAILTDTYGYMVDLAFRTNTYGSTLCLQTDPTDRISVESTKDTLGGGSYLQLTSSNISRISTNSLTEIASAIRVAFVTPSDNGYDILGIAAASKDDVLVATMNTANDTVLTPLYLYSFTQNSGELSVGDRMKSSEIVSLEQNVAKIVDTIVFLDGNKITSKDVSYFSNSAITAKLNLQFASSVDLITGLLSAVEGEENTTIIPVVNELGNSISFNEDGTDTYSYTIQDDALILTSYTGTSTKTYVPGAVTISDSEYRVEIVPTTYSENYKLQYIGFVEKNGQKVSFHTSSAENAFKSCSNLRKMSFSGLDTSNISSIDGMFEGCRSLQELNLSVLNLSNVTNMRRTFHSCSGLKNITFGSSGVITDCREIFSGCSSLGKLDLSTLTLAPTDMTSVFMNCVSVKSIRLGNQDFSRVTSFKDCFGNCLSLADLQGGIDTSSAEDLSRMFFDCQKLAAIDTTLFDTSNCTTMSEMFRGCASLTALDVSGFDTSKVKSFNYTFGQCKSLTSLDVSRFDTGECSNFYAMFWQCESLESLDVTGFDTSKGTNLAAMFAECGSLKAIDLTSFDTSRATSLGGMFKYCFEIESILIDESFNTSNVKYFGEFIADCRKLTEIDLSYLDTSSCENFDSMFRHTDSLETYDLSNFDTSKARYMVEMFENCGTEELDLSTFDTSNVVNMFYMFEDCQKLRSITFGEQFDTSRVMDMGWMFWNCKSLTELDVSGFDTSSCTSMLGMFSDCPNLQSLDVSHFNTSKVTDFKWMFYNCAAVPSLDLSSFDMSRATTIENMFFNCKALTTLTTPAVLPPASLSAPLPAAFAAEGREYSKFNSSLPTRTVLMKAE